jgi:hypothetical protein
MAEIKVTLVNGELAGKTAQDIAKAVRQAAVELSKAKIGTEEWVKANKKLEEAKELQEDLAKQTKSTAAASDMLKQAWNNLPGAQYFNQIADSFGMMKKGVGGLTSQFGVLRTAIIATGIGALVIAIVGLVSWFSKTEKGANMLSGVFKAMGNVLDTLMGRLFNIGTTLRDLFSNPVKFFKDLGNDIAGAAKEGYNLVQVFDDIEDRQREMKITAKENELAINSLLTQAKNVGKTYEERLAILDKVTKLTRDSYSAELALSKEYLDAVEKEVAGELKRQGVTDMTGEQADKIADAKLAYLDLLGQEQAIEDKVANFKEKLFDKQEAANLKTVKSNEARAKSAEDAAKAELDAARNIQDLKDALIADDQQREIEQILTQSERKIEALVGTEEQIAEQKALLQEQEILAVQAVIDKYAADAAAKKEAALAEDLARQQRHDEAVKNMLAERAAFEANLNQAQENLAKDAFMLGVDLLAKTTNNEKAAKAIRKAGALAEIGIALQREKAQNAILAGQFANTIPPPGNVPAFFATLLKLNTVSNARALIGAARVVAFRKGGILNGPSHEGGGIGMRVRGRVVAEAEGGEPILTSAVSRNPVLLAAASRINVAAGGRPLMAEGGITPNESVPSSGYGVELLRAELREERAAMMAYVDKKITTLRVVNDPLQTQSKIDEIKQIENEVNV